MRRVIIDILVLYKHTSSFALIMLSVNFGATVSDEQSTKDTVPCQNSRMHSGWDVSGYWEVP